MHWKVIFKVQEKSQFRDGSFDDDDFWDSSNPIDAYDTLNDTDPDNASVVIDTVMYTMSYTAALTEGIWELNDSPDEINIYDISNLDREESGFDNDPQEFLQNHPELLLARYYDFKAVLVD